MVGKEILQGVVDIHVHAGPSVVTRSLDAAEMLAQAEEVGYAGFVVKDHYIPTVMSATLTEKHFSKRGTRVMGSVVLNNAIGGFNLLMVDTAYRMGAKIVWMPTVSAKNHIETHAKKSFVGAKQLDVSEQPIYYLDENGELCDDVKRLLAYIAGHPDLVLATGHGSVAEIDRLVPAAMEAGVEKLVITHPFSTTFASVDDVKRWVAQGAYVDICAVEFEQIIPTLSRIPLSLVSDYKKVAPLDRLILSSDGGAMTRNGPVSPITILHKFLSLLLENSILTESEVDMMAKQTPKKLLGI